MTAKKETSVAPVGDSRVELIQPRHLWYLLLVLLSGLSGLAQVFVDPIIVLALLLSMIASIIVILFPIVGLIAFVVLSFIRPADIMPALAAIPFAKLVGGITLLAMILKYARTKNFVFGGRQMVLLLVFAATLFASVPFSFWPSRSLEISIDFLKIILSFVILVNIVRDWQTLRIVFLAALLSIVVLCFSTVLSYFSGAFRAASIIGSGMFGDANDVALVLVTAIPLAGFWRLGGIGKPLSRILFWGTIAFLIVGTVATQSRGGLLGLAAVMFVYLMRGRNKMVGIFSFAVVTLFVFLITPSTTTDRYATIADYSEDASAMGRLYAWQAGVHMMISRPLYGVGVGCFGEAFGTVYRPAGFRSSRWIAPHNTLIQVGGETGLIGLAVYLYLIVYCMRELRRMRRDAIHRGKDQITATCDILWASFVGFAVCAFFLTQAFNYMFYVLVASTVSLHNISRNLEDTNAVSSGEREPVGAITP